MELGISTFGEIAGAGEGYRRIQELFEEARRADEWGLDVFALGEHHRADYVVSAPEIILASIASVTQRLRLSSAVTVLSSADPVRVFQNFATLDLVSGGRAEIMAGRGSFIESFPLFGYNLEDYDALFEEKLELLLKIIGQDVINWRGRFRSPIQNQGVYPRPVQSPLPVWIAVGGTPASVVRAGTLNLPLTLAMLGGSPQQFVPLIKLYRESATKAGHDAGALPLAINAHTFIADTSDEAADQFWPIYQRLMNKIGKERGWQPITRPYFERLRAPDGPLFVGDVASVVEKIVYQHSLFGHTRFMAQMISGDIPQMHSIELFANEVAPAVRQHLNTLSYA